MKLRRVGALVALGTAFWTAAPVAAEPPAPPAPPVPPAPATKSRSGTSGWLLAERAPATSASA